MFTELTAILAVGVSQTLLMVTLAGFLLAAQRGLRQELAALARSQADLARSQADLARSLAEVRERVARVEGLIEGLRDAVAGGRRGDTGRTDAA